MQAARKRQAGGQKVGQFAGERFDGGLINFGGSGSLWRLGRAGAGGGDFFFHRSRRKPAIDHLIEPCPAAIGGESPGRLSALAIQRDVSKSRHDYFATDLGKDFISCRCMASSLVLRNTSSM